MSSDAVGLAQRGLVVGAISSVLPSCATDSQKYGQHLAGGSRVKAGAGFVGQDEGRIVRQSARDGDPLLLAAREVLRPMREPRGQS